MTDSGMVLSVLPRRLRVATALGKGRRRKRSLTAASAPAASTLADAYPLAGANYVEATTKELDAIRASGDASKRHGRKILSRTLIEANSDALTTGDCRDGMLSGGVRGG
ncbi:hypothetical protein MASR2M8_13470 [Opitutaceae bacterium]